MVAHWLEDLRATRLGETWTVYPETGGWDLLLVHRDGFQLGLEAKLSLNAKVLEQALKETDSYWRPNGPDYRGVLVPAGKCQHHLTSIARALGIGIVTVRPRERGVRYAMNLPGEEPYHSGWASWLPAQRVKLPAYVPDVEAGHSAPVMLTDWKIRAIKLLIVLGRRGFVTRADMKALQISPTRWCDGWHGFLDRGADGYIRGERTPDLKAQHPRNWDEIEGDIAIWAKDLESIERVEAAA